MSGHVSSANQSSLGDTAVAAKAGQQVRRHSRFNLGRQMRRGERDVVFQTRNTTQIANNATSTWVTARRTATTSGHCDIGLDRRRKQVAAKGGGAPCVS